MKVKTLFLTICAASLLAGNASAFLSIIVSLQPTLLAGPDPRGFNGSTWTFRFNSSQTNYIPYLNDHPLVISDNATLTVSGAGDPAYNGTFTIVEQTSTNFYSYPNFNDNANIGRREGIGAPSFSFGPDSIQINNFLLQATAIANPGTMDSIQVSDWQGIIVDGPALLIEGNVFDFGTGTVEALVPEPSTYAALAGLAVLGVVIFLRRQRRSAA